MMITAVSRDPELFNNNMEDISITCVSKGEEYSK